MKATTVAGNNTCRNMLAIADNRNPEHKNNVFRPLNHHVMPKNNVPDVLCLPQKQYFCENEKRRRVSDGNISSV
jgi:hypothetical protein